MDNAKEMSVIFAGLDFAKRGINTLAIDGPGQSEPLRLRNVHSRHDYEAAGIPAYDYVASRPEVDPKRVAVMGYSFGGYHAPRVAARALRTAAELGSKPALIDGPTGRTLTYAGLEAGIRSLAGGLQARGFGPGVRLLARCVQPFGLQPGAFEPGLLLLQPLEGGGAVAGLLFQICQHPAALLPGRIQFGKAGSPLLLKSRELRLFICDLGANLVDFCNILVDHLDLVGPQSTKVAVIRQISPKFGGIALTRMGCPPGSQDGEFLRSLDQVARYAIASKSLLSTITRSYFSPIR